VKTSNLILYIIIFLGTYSRITAVTRFLFSDVRAIQPLVEQLPCPVRQRAKHGMGKGLCEPLFAKLCEPLFARLTDSVIWTCGFGVLLAIDRLNTKGSFRYMGIILLLLLPSGLLPSFCNESQTEDSTVLSVASTGRSSNQRGKVCNVCFGLFRKPIDRACGYLSYKFGYNRFISLAFSIGAPWNFKWQTIVFIVKLWNYSDTSKVFSKHTFLRNSLLFYVSSRNWTADTY
jgi:hypothetical protein